MSELTLDCSSLAAVEQCLARLFDMSEHDLRGRLQDVVCRGSSSIRECLLWEAFGLHEDNLRMPAYVLLYHASRVQNVDAFCDSGIQTRFERRGALAQLIRSVCDLVGASCTCLNGAEDRLLWHSENTGPHAFLMLEAAINRAQIGRRYHEVPGWLSELTSRCDGGQCQRVLDAHHAITTPCIVSFRRPCTVEHVKSALHYVYLSLIQPEHSSVAFEANTNFDGGGAGVPVSDLIRVEILDERSRPLTLRQSDPSTPSKHPTRRMRDHLTVENCS